MRRSQTGTRMECEATCGENDATTTRFSVRFLSADSETGPELRENMFHAFWGVTENLSLGVFLSEKLPRHSCENIRGGLKIAPLDHEKC